MYILIEKVSVNSARNKKRAQNYRSVDVDVSISIWEAIIKAKSINFKRDHVGKEGDILQRSDSIRFVAYYSIYYYFISFPFRNHQSKQKAKLVPNSHPFSIEYPHHSTTLAFRVFGFLSLHAMLFFLVA